jgi:hypothetical protein
VDVTLARTETDRSRFVLIASLAVAAAAVAAGGCADSPQDVVRIVPDSLQMGQVAHWTFDEPSGAAVLDSSGFERHGTLMQSGATQATRVAGQFGGGIELGGGAFISVPAFPQATESWSVSLWVRLPAGDLGATDYVTLVSNETVFAGGWEMNVVPGTEGNDLFHFAYWQGPNMADYAHYNCKCVERERWIHLVEVIDGQALTMRLYKDGVARSAIDVRQPISRGEDTLYFGRWMDVGRLLNGQLDDVTIYNRALVLHEVEALSRMPAPVPP